MDIVLKVWNNVKLNLASAKVYTKDFLFFYIVFIILSFFIINNTLILILISFLHFLLNIILLYFLGKKRINELETIRTVISGIKINRFKSPDEIELHENLYPIQDEIRQMFEKERSDIDYLKRLERMRTEFLGNVSHELRTPIFAIQGYIETLLNGALDDEKVNKYFLEKANQHTINLSNLLNDLIDISMIESGEMRMSYRYFDINSYLNKIVHEMKPL
ncbi:MAG: two-component sensor histidine kinase, partial [Ignavibacteriales bacterium]